jgi:uncharacterized protein (DUF4415 family)
MKKEFNFKKAKKVGSKFKDADIKVAITTRIDPDVVIWLREESEKRGIPYQTLINSLLKQAMNAESNDDHIRKIVKEELGKKAI